jgi:branched-chain amino acid transport system substrate-binding protein
MAVLNAMAVALLLQVGPPVFVGLDLEFGHQPSTSDDAIQRGVEVAVAEINAAGGVLGGRPLQIVALDNRSVTARGLENVRTLAARKDLVAFLCGKFSPIALQEVPLVHELELPMLDPWAAADAIIDHGRHPSFTFRLSPADRWAMARLLRTARERRLTKVGLLLVNTGWGRSAEASAKVFLAAQPGMSVVGTRWFNWRVPTLLPEYEALRAAGAQAIVLVTNELEGATLVREVAALPAAQRLPILAHHGIVGGDLVAMVGPALHEVDLSIVQVFSPASARARKLMAALRERYGLSKPEQAPSVGGTATAYDLTRLLGMAIDLAGSADRRAVRAALERLPAYDGVVRRFEHPFTATRHEALGPDDLFMARFDRSGTLVRVPGP